ncbi:MAG: hypothetical protein WC623_22360 [Pedobacter sp.]|uniref:hypothetical protein n=1 Tax=Pedobacter sp. TaxID=1411316 RepID=UPI0035621F02
MERRLLPIYSCADCHFLGKEIVAKNDQIGEKGRFTTYCTHLAGKTIIIKHGTEPTPEHFEFPKWCILAVDKS